MEGVDRMSTTGTPNPPCSEQVRNSIVKFWRDDRAAEGARLEVVCTRKGTVGSNPTLSVKIKKVANILPEKNSS